MPKLAEEQIRKRKRRVEDAALTLFKTQGFNGVGLRHIAQEAGVSLGNIYNYYEGKEELFNSILERLHSDFIGPDTPLAAYFETANFPDDMDVLGRVIGRMVDTHADYLTLIYVDLAEFRGRHVRPFYQGLPDRFRVALGDSESVVAFTVAYMQFFNYFIVERMIGATGHLGVSGDDAVESIAQILRGGVSKASQ
jgi:AcrR family transcriptional regulator